MGKTGPLIRLSIVLPAVAGGAMAAALQLLERVALFWGLSYQILDDIKDVHRKPHQAGKTVVRDGKLSRPNVALAVGVEKPCYGSRGSCG